MRKYKYLIWTLILFCPSNSVFASDFSGKVVGVSDGDTISVMHGGHPERIRLSGIDCPEKNQAFGTKAKQFTSSSCFGKNVTVTVITKDRYGRTVGEITLSNGRNLNHELVKAGFAWWYRQYAPNDQELNRLENEARNQKKGLWVDPSPIAPWDFRHPGVKNNKTLPVVKSEKKSPQTGCDPNYTPCIPNVDYDLDCPDIGFAVQVIGYDKHRLDRDHDGSGCE